MTKNTRFPRRSVIGPFVWLLKTRTTMTRSGRPSAPSHLKLAARLRLCVSGCVSISERDAGGGDGGLTTAGRQRLKELEMERENRELRRSNDILRQASAYFAKAGFDRLWKK